MKIKIGKKIIEINTTGKPNDELWRKGKTVRLGKRFFPARSRSFYIIIWE